MTINNKNMSPVYCALDLRDLVKAEQLAGQLKEHVRGFKLGLEFFLAHGAAGFRLIAKTGLPIFLDVKLHDIPNTVSGALGALLSLKPAFVTIHASGGEAMMRNARDAVQKEFGRDPGNAPKLLGVTVLTSMDREDLIAVGQASDPEAQVLRLARLAKKSGMDGVICSSREIGPIRAALGPDFILMVPGIRPIWAAQADQKRVMGPKEAMDAGASYLVIGRPIMDAKDPVRAAELIAHELSLPPRAKVEAL